MKGSAYKHKYLGGFCSFGEQMMNKFDVDSTINNRRISPIILIYDENV
jgi:hypothetical protein